MHQADNLHGNHHDAHGKNQDGGHKREPPQSLQTPGLVYINIENNHHDKIFIHGKCFFILR